MKILEPQSAVLTNAEALNHLQSIAARRRAQAGGRGVPPLKSPNFETVLKELTAYLAPPHATPLPPYSQTYDAFAIRRAMAELAPYTLSRAELLMVLNLRPQSGARLDAIVEEMDARLTPAQQEEVLAIVERVLGGRPGSAEGEVAEEAAGGRGKRKGRRRR